MRTTIKVYLRGINGEEDYFTTLINLPEQEAHDYYFGKWWNMGIVEEEIMKCYKTETISKKQL